MKPVTKPLPEDAKVAEVPKVLKVLAEESSKEKKSLGSFLKKESIPESRTGD